MRFNPTAWRSQNPRVALTQPAYDRAYLGALRLEASGSGEATRRFVVEQAITEYLDAVEHDRTHALESTFNEVVIHSGSPGVRIAAALWQRLAAEAQRQSDERGGAVAMGQLATVAVTQYLDRKGIPHPAPRPRKTAVVPPSDRRGGRRRE